LGAFLIQGESMNPKEFDWREDQQVTVTNPTAADFLFQGVNKKFVVKAGQTVKLNGYVAMLFVYKLAIQMAQNDGQFINFIDEDFRKKYYDKLVVGVDEDVQIVDVQPINEAPMALNTGSGKRGRPASS
jgi:hypothetical protein